MYKIIEYWSFCPHHILIHTHKCITRVLLHGSETEKILRMKPCNWSCIDGGLILWLTSSFTSKGPRHSQYTEDKISSKTDDFILSVIRISPIPDPEISSSLQTENETMRKVGSIFGFQS